MRERENGQTNNTEYKQVQMRLFKKQNKKWKTGDAKDRGNNNGGWKIKNYTRKKIIYIEVRQQHRNKTK